MATKFRIGYPYASSSPERTRESVVVLKPIPEYSGFNTIFVGDKMYVLPNTDEGPTVLNGYRGGVVGELLEVEDSRKSIAKKNGKIHGQGVSMQLALVLAACATYDDENDIGGLPLLLFSAAIRRPVGAPPFLDAKVATYCSEQEAEFCLVQKYKAARMARARALVVPKRDAQILARATGDKVYDMASLGDIDSRSTSARIVGITEKSLPELAEILGISSYHYGNTDDVPEQLQHRVFLSYAAKDRFIAETIAETIESFGYLIYLDQSSNCDEEGWKNHIREKIEKCLCLVCCITPRLQMNERLKYQLQQAGCRYIPVLPLYFEDSDFPILEDENFSRIITGINFVEHSKKSGSERLRQVLSGIVTEAEQGIFSLEFPSQGILCKLKVGYTYSIGRDRSTFIQFPQGFTEVSRRHVLIDLTVMPPMLISLGRNGTYLDDEKIDKDAAIPVDRQSRIKLAHYDKNLLILTPIQENLESYRDDLTQTHILSTTSDSDS